MSLLNNQLMADSVAGIYQDLEELLMRNIVRHIRDYGKPIDSDDWQLQKLAELGALNKENIRIIAQQAGISLTAAERMLNEAAQESIRQLEPCLQNAAKDGLLHTAVDVDKSKNIKRTVEALQTQAKDSLNLCNTNMLYKARDAYKNLVQNICSVSKEIEQKQDFIDLMNKSAANTVIGAESRTQAVRSCIKQFNEKGIPAFVDKAGREWTPEAYVNMCMRNTAKNVADEVQSERCKEYGCNLIEISSHSGARPKCSKDQGKIFDLDNGSGYTEDARGKKIRYYPWNSSSYGEPDGILGINCGHYKYPFVPGVNIKTYFPFDKEENDKLYEQTQVQRTLERDVRKQKRECMLYDELGDTEAFEKAAVKLKSKEAKLKNYVDNNDNLHRRKDREQVVGFDKSLSSKAVQVNKKNKSKNFMKNRHKNSIESVEESNKSDIISHTRESLQTTGVEYREVKTFKVTPSKSEIIKRLGGGDLTKGSCSSLAFAYVGNTGGFDVLDFRDGLSRSIFASNKTIDEIAALPGVKGFVVKDFNDFTAANKLLKMVEEGKEYYLGTGRHAAIIRKIENNFEYLELQSPTDNGFKLLTKGVLKKRFGCKKSHTTLGTKVQVSNQLIECESLSESNEFQRLLGYINTSSENQKKGMDGYVK